MATLMERMRWRLYNIKKDIMFEYGRKHNLIFLYGKEYIDKLRDIYHGPIPLSLLLLLDYTSNGFCYYRGPLVAYGFLDDDFECIDASIDSIRFNPELIYQVREGILDENLYGDHCFVVRKLEDGSEWVYDASLGLIFEKKFYFALEHPKIRVRHNKDETLEFLEYECPRTNNLENDKYTLSFILPAFESNIVPLQDFYTDTIKREIELLKEKVRYDDIVKEMRERKRSSI